MAAEVPAPSHQPLSTAPVRKSFSLLAGALPLADIFRAGALPLADFFSDGRKVARVGGQAPSILFRNMYQLLEVALWRGLSNVGGTTCVALRRGPFNVGWVADHCQLDF